MQGIARIICVGSGLSFGSASYFLAQGAEGLPPPNWTNLGVAGILATILGFFIRYVAHNVVPEMLKSNQAAFEAMAKAHEKAVATLIESNREALLALTEDRKHDRAMAREDLQVDRAQRREALVESMREIRERNDQLDRKLDELNNKLDYNNRLLLLIRERGCKNVPPGSPNSDESGILGPQILTRPRRPDPPKGDKPEGGKK